MSAQPDFAAFRTTYEAGRPNVVWHTMVADLETPVSAFLKLGSGQPNAFLLESVEGGATRGRYSVIGLRPDLVWRCRGDAPGQPRRPCPPRTLSTCPVAERAAPGQPARPGGRNAASTCPPRCRRWRPGWSVTWATTWCG